MASSRVAPPWSLREDHGLRQVIQYRLKAGARANGTGDCGGGVRFSRQFQDERAGVARLLEFHQHRRPFDAAREGKSMVVGASEIVVDVNRLHVAGELF